MAMANLFSADSPYVHSNYFLFSNNLKQELYSYRAEEGKSKIQEKIQQLTELSKQLKVSADDFLMGKKPKEAFDEMNNAAALFSKIGRQVVSLPQGRDILTKQSYSREDLQQILGDQMSGEIVDTLIDDLDLNQIVDIIIKNLYTEDFKKSSGKQQAQVLAQTLSFNGTRASEEVEDEIRSQVKKKLRSEKGKLRDIVKKAVKKAFKGRMNPAGNYYVFFEREFKNLLRQQNIVYDEVELEKYLRAVKDKLNSKLKKYYTSQGASAALGEEIWASVNDTANGFIIEVTGSDTEKEIRNKYGMLETAATWNDISKFSYTDMIMTNRNGVRVRVQSKNYTGAYQTYLRTEGDGGDVEQHTRLFSEEMLFTEFLDKLERSGNFSGSFDKDALGYTIANELWFDQKGSIDRGSMKGREGKTHTRLFGSDSWLSKQLSSAFVNFLGVVIGENGEVLTDLSNIFFLIDNIALVPTYQIIDDIINYYEKGLMGLNSITITPKRTGIHYAYGDPLEFYKEKAEAVGKEGLGKATYTNPSLVGVGKRQGAQIMSSFKISGVNLDQSIRALLTSAWAFKG